jgi:hypothetical protein
MELVIALFVVTMGALDYAERINRINDKRASLPQF